MIIGIPKETFPNERRVALVPSVLAPLAKVGVQFVMEAGAGAAAGFADALYAEKGVKIVPSRDTVFAEADLVTQVRGIGSNAVNGDDDLARMKQGQIVIAFFEPLAVPEAMDRLAAKGVIGLSMELMPRITRAQSMDALSSMATVAGYLAVLRAANRLPKFFPMFMTAAGNINPAKVFILGAGVAGLQAISTARRLGSVVSAYDTRPVVKEQVMSLGAKFVELPLETAGSQDAGGYAKAQSDEFYRKQRELMTDTISHSDVVVTTANVPGKKAPVLVTKEQVETMAPGSVIVDLAAEKGGNCELTKAGEEVVHNGVLILGPVNLPTDLPFHASQMYGKNMQTFLSHLLGKEGKLNLDPNDEIVAGTMVCRDGKVIHPAVLQAKV